MDEDVSRWIVEFLLRQPIPDGVVRKALSLLPLPNRDSRFKKTLLLRSIQGEAKAGSTLPEAVLENLELIEELDRFDGVVVTDSMRVAYCAVAVCCTLEHVGDGEYFAAVRRIWRGKVDKMEGKSGLFSDELAKWRDEIEAAVVNEDARRNLLKKKRNVGEDALWSVKSYLEEAWAIMGPPFLESAAKAMMGKQGSSIGSEQADHSMKVTAASEHDLTRDVGGNDGGRVELGAQMVNQAVVQGLSDRQLLNKVGERAASSHDSGQNLGGDASDRVEVAPQLANQEVHGLGGRQVADNVVLGVASLHDSSQDLGGGEGDGPELTAKAINPEQVQGSGSKQVGETDGKMTVNSHRKKHAARRRRIGRRAEIVDTEDSGSDVSCTRHDCLPSPEVRQVQEALKTSNMELRAVVKDPLPDALKMSETVRCELQRKHVSESHMPSVENQNRADVVREPIPDIGRTDVQTGEANTVNQKNAAKRPGWMERNSTARTYEWDEIESDSSGGMSKGMKRIHLPTPKRIDCSPLKNVGAAAKISKRRKVRRWSTLEEDTLRTGVHLYGKGNWKTILTNYSDIFEERTDVDLKDKWRNMTR